MKGDAMIPPTPWGIESHDKFLRVCSLEDDGSYGEVVFYMNHDDQLGEHQPIELAEQNSSFRPSTATPNATTHPVRMFTVQPIWHLRKFWPTTTQSRKKSRTGNGSNGGWTKRAGSLLQSRPSSTHNGNGAV
jgi:hypothetical protein